MAIMEEIDHAKPKETVEKLEHATEHCPACVVSAWKQANPMTEYDRGGFIDGDHETYEAPLWLEYDYKAKSAEYMAEKRREETAQFNAPYDF